MVFSADGDPLRAPTHPAALLQRLLRFDTTNPPGNEGPCIAYLAELLRAHEIPVQLVANDPARPNLLARLPGSGAAPPLLLYGHVDVVPTAHQTWRHPPFGGEEVDGYLWGRGALDMKGGVAMMVAAMLRAKLEGLTPAGDVLLAVLSDEEAGGEFGARYLVEEHPRLFDGVRYALSEFGGFTLHLAGKRFYPIQVAEKVSCVVRATVRGPGGHGSLPFRGGAMARLGRFLLALDGQRLPVHVTPVARAFITGLAAELPLPLGQALDRVLDPATTDEALDQLGPLGTLLDALLHNTVNATMVRGGDALNVLPGEITVSLDGRLLPGFGPDDLLGELRALVGGAIDLRAEPDESSMMAPDLGLFPTLAAVLREADPAGMPVPFLLPAVTDGRFFARLGIQTYGYTPMLLPEDFAFTELMHAADERIPVEALSFGAHAIFEVARRFGR